MNSQGVLMALRNGLYEKGTQHLSVPGLELRQIQVAVNRECSAEYSVRMKALRIDKDTNERKGMVVIKEISGVDSA
jgi:hypothetical protein